MSTPISHLEVIYCDSLRTETSGKQLYVGVYNGQALIENFPTILPELWVCLTFVCCSTVVPGALRFALFKDDSLMAEFVIPQADLAELKSNAGLHEPNAKLLKIQKIFAFSSVAIDQPCVFRARAYADHVEYAAGALEIEAVGAGVVD